MALETVNHTSKDWLEVDTHADSHLTAVERANARDWPGRLHALYLCWTNGLRVERDCGEIGLRSLLLGTERLDLDEKSLVAAAFLSEFRSAMKDAFREPVMTQLRECGQVNLPWNKAFEWKTMRRERNAREPMLPERGLRLLRELYDAWKQTELQTELSDLELFRKARNVSVDT